MCIRDRGTALDELAALWDARAALTAAQNAVTEQEAKLTELSLIHI